jgi:hypothetical protein
MSPRRVGTVCASSIAACGNNKYQWVTAYKNKTNYSEKSRIAQFSIKNAQLWPFVGFKTGI